jgi:formylglycine-generating enzyme required for sulfatase activity/tRNA A-37 threonylcarbamoyl transferase component Bud32
MRSSETATPAAAPGGDGSRDCDAGLDAADQRELKPGLLVGRYIVIGKVGAGAMGLVLAAYDPELDRKIALKLLRPRRDRDALHPEEHARLRARLGNEARALARLSHPNLISIHDVGVHEQEVYLAMEFMAGGTLREWLQRPGRSRREVLSTFQEIGRGLAAAHSAGLVHRDLKPENILFDAAGRPKIADFGLARLMEPAPDVPGADAAAAQPTSTFSSRSLATSLTGSNAVVGTPAYMAPEQFTNGAIDPRTDQYAYCVALYEALYGERPFAGTNVLELAASVMTGSVRRAPPGSDVPTWLRKVLVRGLSRNCEDRFPSMDHLVQAVSRDPRARLRRGLLAATLGLSVLATVAVAIFTIVSHRRSIARAIESSTREAGTRLTEAQRKALVLEQVRTAALQRFDAGEAPAGEKLWVQVLAHRQGLLRTYAGATQAAERAFLIDPARVEARALLAEVIYQRVRMDAWPSGAVDPDGLHRLQLYGGQSEQLRRLTAPGRLRLTVRPRADRVVLERFERAADGAGGYTSVGEHPSAPDGLSLPAGSYRLTVSSAGREPVTGTVLLDPGADVELRVDLPAAGAIPADFVIVPAGEFLLGSAAEEDHRRQLQRAAPLHRVQGRSFLIKKHETTFREWIEYLRALPPRQRADRRPSAGLVKLQGTIDLRQLSADDWELSLQPSEKTFRARLAQPIRYVKRKHRQEQSWLDMPVSGVSRLDAEAYTAWLGASGHVPGARLCTDVEWEHAARGADGRPFPHGWKLEPGDANYDATWGTQNAEAYGPDEVGSYPRSASPYGVHDMAGNVFEWVRSSQHADAGVARGGAFPFDDIPCRAEFREVGQAERRVNTIGLRVCADWPSGEGGVR